MTTTTDTRRKLTNLDHRHAATRSAARRHDRYYGPAHDRREAGITFPYRVTNEASAR